MGGYLSRPVQRDPDVSTGESASLLERSFKYAQDKTKNVFPITCKMLEKTWPEKGGILRTAAKIGLVVASIFAGCVELVLAWPIKGIVVAGKKVCLGASSAARSLWNMMPSFHGKTEPAN